MKNVSGRRKWSAVSDSVPIGQIWWGLRIDNWIWQYGDQWCPCGIQFLWSGRDQSTITLLSRKNWRGKWSEDSWFFCFVLFSFYTSFSINQGNGMNNMLSGENFYLRWWILMCLRYRWNESGREKNWSWDGGKFA